MHNNSVVSVGWQKEPVTRGTFTIVWIPLLTLFTCVWTATHLNLPRHHELAQEWWRRKHLRRRILWFVVGVFFPEAIVWCALRQFKEARKLDNFVQNLLHEERPRRDDYLLKSVWRRAIRIFLPGRIDRYNKRDDLEIGNTPRDTPMNAPETPQNEPLNTPRRILARKHQWTFIHSFYATMGGFAIDIGGRPVNERFLPSKQTRCALTASGVAALFNRNPAYIPDISRLEIDDKSKDGSFAKFFVCLQLIWFLSQCIARVAGQANLKLCLFEANVMAHVFWAIFAYVLWWDKPFEVDVPTIIEDPALDKIIASMCIFNGFRLDDMDRPSSFMHVKKKWIKDQEITFNVDSREHHGQSEHSPIYGFEFSIPPSKEPELLNCCQLASKALEDADNYQYKIIPQKWERFLLGRISQFPKTTYDLDEKDNDVANLVHIPFFNKEFKISICQFLILTLAGAMYGGIHKGLKLEQDLPRPLQILSAFSIWTLIACSAYFLFITLVIWRFSKQMRENKWQEKVWLRCAFYFPMFVYAAAKFAMFAGCWASLHYLTPEILRAGQPLPWIKSG